jgi:hypothetical protein
MCSVRAFLLPLTSLALCATAALALPSKAEAVIRLSSPNMVSLTNGLVGYWTFDGPVTNWTTGKSFDISGRGNTGQLTLMSTSSSPMSGKIGQAFYFDGPSNQRLVVDDNNSLDFGAGDISVAFWIKNTAPYIADNEYLKSDEFFPVLSLSQPTMRLPMLQ